jgi:4a-hydroxytetrahydrobiopterin dehydratase
MVDLVSKNSIPSRRDVPALKVAELHNLSHQLPNWEVVNDHHIRRSFKFPDFQKALDFVNRVGAIAEELGHHPEILLSWGKAEITAWTHAMNGLTERDFILAAKIDEI